MTRQEADALVKQARAQPELRKELSATLPKLLETQTDRLILITEARIAGELEIATATSALAKLLSRPDTQLFMPSTLTSEYLLDNDPVGKALADIGEPALPALKASLENVNRDTRQRAAAVLILMNTHKSFSILRHHVSHESDDQLHRYIAGNLARAEELKHEK